MLEALSYDFVINALVAGVLVSLISGIIGSLIVVNRMVFLVGGIAHASYGGIGLALFFGLPIFLGASLFSVLAAVLIAFVTLKEKKNADIFIGLIWAVGMAVGIIFIDLTSGYQADLMSYLFGSILSVSKEDIYYTIALLFLIFFIVTVFYREILAVSYDSEYARLRGINDRLFYTMILVISSLSIVVAIKVVGLILVIALFTIPVYISLRICDSLGLMMLLSGVLSSVFSVIGLYISYFYDITSGASIILVGAIFLALFELRLALRNKE